MPVHLSRRLTGKTRSHEANRDLGYLLAFVAGAVNAGGYLAVAQYTSHMTGIVSLMADNVALGRMWLVLGGLCSLAAFIGGAACTAILVNYARRRALHSEYAAPLMVEAVLLMAFGIIGAKVAASQSMTAAVTVVLLCFLMGLQNAVITKVSGAVIRTTHVTGIATDLGIELGKWLYRTRPDDGLPPVVASRDRLRVLATLLALFFGGGVVGAFGFKIAGYVATVPLAALLVLAAIVPIHDDIAGWLRRQRG